MPFSTQIDTTSKYRADIDGMRAVAVVAVVLFHAHIFPFSGGYVGVDVFFVISGFLITRLIGAEIDERRFSVLQFYERRIRRIFPALYVMVAVAFVPALLLLLPLDLKRFSEAASATTVFASNALFWHRSGYFGESGTVQPLLHTWSLAVEEQFYVVYPLFLIVTMRLLHNHVARILLLAGLLLASLLASVIMTHYWPSAAFYLPVSRAWELLLGAILAMLPAIHLPWRGMRELLGLAGLAAIAASVFAFSPETAFPGYAALLPCLGAAAIILAGSGGGSLASALLATSGFRFVGLISYSLYLWHWPLLVFTQYWYDQHAPAWAIALAVLASIVLGIISWRWIEMPFRRKGTLSRRAVFSLALVVSILIFGAGAAVSLLDGLPGRIGPQALAYAAGERDVAPDRVRCLDASPRGRNLDGLCRMGAPAPVEPSFILWGDSHAEAMRSAISEAGAIADRSGLFAGRPGCPPMLEVTRMDNLLVCEPFSRDVFDAILANPGLRTVILDGRWGLYGAGTRYEGEEGPPVYLRDHETTRLSREENALVFERGLIRTIDALIDAGRQVILVGPIPEVGYHVPRSLALASQWSRPAPASPTTSAFLERQRIFFDVVGRLGERDGLTVVLPHEVLCAQDHCSIAGAGQSYYFDDDHLSRTGARHLTSLYVPLLER